MSRNKKIVLSSALLFGLLVPFIPAVVAIEMFILIIPFVLIIAGTLINLVVSTLNKKMDLRKALFLFSTLPIFILAQLLSVFSVNKIQRFRSTQAIGELERIKNETGLLPVYYDLKAGIKYTKMKDEEYFKLEYSRGFMVTEEYYSGDGIWSSFGWND